MMKYKKIIIAIILAIVMFIGYKNYINKKANTPTYQTTIVEKGNLISTITASGTVNGGNSVVINTSATGVIKNVYVKSGDKVVKGQKLAEITLDQDANSKYLSAYSAYLGAKNSLESAKTTLYTLDSSMWAAHQIFRNDAQERNLTFDDPAFIQQNDNWKAAEAKVINQQQVIKQSEVSLQSAYLSYLQASPIIYAPISGTISNVNMAEGLVLTATSTSNSSASLQKVGTIRVKQGQMQATVSLTEMDVTKVKAGQKVTVTMDAFTGKTFAGTVAAIDTSGQTSSGVTSYPTTIVFNTDIENMYPGMAVSAKIITEVKNDVVLVNNGAITSQNGDNIVKIMKGGKINEVVVETGSNNETQTEIISGINEGDVVVTGSTTGKTTTTKGATSVFGGGGGGGQMFRQMGR